MADSPRFDRQSFQEWKAHPLTQRLLSLMLEVQASMMDRWGRGQEMDRQDQTKALFLREWATLNWRDVEQMYAEVDEWAEIAREHDRDPTDDEGSGAQ